MVQPKNTAKTKVISRFPKKELNTWLKGRDGWNHNEWLSLLDDLRKSGFATWVETQDGQQQLGEYLESTRGSLS